MKAAVVNLLGDPPCYQEFQEPHPLEGEVLIHVRAAGLHPIVRALASGAHYAGRGEVPAVPGIDGVGLLDDGHRVYFSTFGRNPWGTMSERTVAQRSRCISLPEGIDDLQAAALVNPAMSGWLALKERVRLQRGETVLILGATGVAGQLAIQAARHLGASRIIATGRNLPALAALNPDAMISLAQPDDAIREAFMAETKQGLDVVIDYLWGRPTELLMEALAKGFDPNAGRSTRWVEVGESAGKSISLPGATLRSVDLTLMGGGFGSVPLQQVLDAIPTLFALGASGALTVPVDPVPLAGVEAAWNRRESGKRIVFTF